MGSWTCPHEVNDVCQKVNQLPCDPDRKGCVLSGRFVFSNPAKNRTVNPGVRAKAEEPGHRPAKPASSRPALLNMKEFGRLIS